MASKTKQMMRAMEDAFLPEKAGSTEARIQLDLTGQDSGLWLLDIAKGECQVREEEGDSPDVTVTIDAQDFAALYHDELNPIQAFMRGQIKVRGNVGLAMQMLNWFER